MSKNEKQCDDGKEANKTADYEKMFNKRFTDSDEDFILALKTVHIEPICISPWKIYGIRQNIAENGRFYEGQRFTRGGRGRGCYRDENFSRRRGDYHSWN